MNQRTWQKARALFEVLVELPAGEREAIVESACGADPALRAHLNGLLEADSLPRHFMDEDAFTLYLFLAQRAPEP